MVSMMRMANNWDIYKLIVESLIIKYKTRKA